jgi:hypothetical protein
VGVIGRNWLRRFLASIGLVVAFFFGVIAVHMAAAVALLWTGPIAALAVYVLAVAVFLTCITLPTDK